MIVKQPSEFAKERFLLQVDYQIGFRSYLDLLTDLSTCRHYCIFSGGDGSALGGIIFANIRVPTYQYLCQFLFRYLCNTMNYLK
jgi:hypothetical protein